MQGKAKNLDSIFSRGCLGCCSLWIDFVLIGGYAGTPLLWAWCKLPPGLQQDSCPARDLLAFSVVFLLVCLKSRNNLFILSICTYNYRACISCASPGIPHWWIYLVLYSYR